MIWLIAYLAYVPLSLFLLWVFFLAVMNLGRVRALDREDRNHAAADPTFTAPPLRMTPFVASLGTGVLIIGYLLDCLVNISVLTVLLFEFPHELTVTARLKRHNEETFKWYETMPWNKALVRWFEPLLNPYDPKGKHI